MNGFVDIHQHLVWGVDDGAKTIEDSVALLRCCADQGIRIIIATPHFLSGIEPFPYKKFKEHFLKLRRICKEEGIPIKLLPGAEVFYTANTLNMLLDGRVPTLNGTRFILVEFNESVTWKGFEKAVRDLFNNGYRPIVAHIERYPAVYSHRRQLRLLKEETRAKFQMNCGSIINPRSLRQKRFTESMLKERLIDAVATDSHNMEYRPPNMLRAYGILKDKYGSEYAYRLTHFGF